MESSINHEITSTIFAYSISLHQLEVIENLNIFNIDINMLSSVRWHFILFHEYMRMRFLLTER